MLLDLDKQIYSAALMATSTHWNKSESDCLKLKQSGNARRVSMNTPPSASPKPISTTKVLAHSPGFSSLGSGFDFHTEPLGLSNLDSSDASLEFSPILPIDRSSRSSGDQPPPNAANLTHSPHVVYGDVLKDGKGRARSRSVPVGPPPPPSSGLPDGRIPVGGGRTPWMHGYMDGGRDGGREGDGWKN